MVWVTEGFQQADSQDQLAPKKPVDVRAEFDELSAKTRASQPARDAERLALLRQEADDPSIAPADREAVRREIAGVTAATGAHAGELTAPRARAARWENISFEPVEPPKPAQPQAPATATAADIIKAPVRGVLEGVGSIAQLAAEGIAQPVNAVFGTDLQTTNPGRELGDAVIPYSEGGARAKADSMPDGDIFDPSTYAMPKNLTAGGAALNVLEGAGQLVGPGAILAKGGLKVGEKVAGRALAAGKTAEQASKAAVVAEKATEIAGFTGMSMAQQADEIRQSILQDPQKQALLMQTQVYRDALAAGADEGKAFDVALRRAQTGGFYGGAPGGSAEAVLGTLLISRLRGRAKLKGNAVTAGAVSALGEGAQEVVEGVGGRIGANLATGGQVFDPTAGTVSDFVGGAIVGGPIGAVSHGAAKTASVVPRETGHPTSDALPAAPALALPGPATQTGSLIADADGTVRPQTYADLGASQAAQQAAPPEVPAKVGMGYSSRALADRIAANRAKQGAQVEVVEDPATGKFIVSDKTAPNVHALPEAYLNGNPHEQGNEIIEQSADGAEQTVSPDQAEPKVTEQAAPAEPKVTEQAAPAEPIQTADPLAVMFQQAEEDVRAQKKFTPRPAVEQDGVAAPETAAVVLRGARDIGFGRQPAQIKRAKMVKERPDLSWSIEPYKDALQVVGRIKERLAQTIPKTAQTVDSKQEKVDRNRTTSDFDTQNEAAKATKSTVDAAANAAAASPKNDLPMPTPAQIEAGNQKMGHIKIHGLDVSIEFPAGSKRRGASKDGKQWERQMTSHYGYFKGTVGKDKDHVDTYVGPHPDASKAYVIDQVKADGRLDEHKVMLGYPSMEAARDAYMAHYPDNWTGLGKITPAGIDRLKGWLKDGDKSKPYREAMGFADAGNKKTEGQETAQVSGQNQPETLMDTAPESKPKNSVRQARVDKVREAMRSYFEQADKPVYAVLENGDTVDWSSNKALAEKAAAKRWDNAEVRRVSKAEFESVNRQERRKDTAQRKRIDDMTADEMRKALKTNELTGLPNRRAWEERKPLPYQASIDADYLGAANKLMGQESGDLLIRANANALLAAAEKAGVEVYHISGDEFRAQAKTGAKLRKVLDAARETLAGTRFEGVELATGQPVTLTRLGFSYGIERTTEAADRELIAEKAQRKAQGLRSEPGTFPAGVVEKVPAGRGQTDAGGDAGRQGDQGQVAKPAQSAVRSTGEQDTRPAYTAAQTRAFERLRDETAQLGKNLSVSLVEPNAASQSKDASGLRQAAGVARDLFKQPTVFVDSNQLFNGIAKDGIVFLDVKSELPAMAVLGHEMTHRMRQDRPDLYEFMQEAVKPYLKNLDQAREDLRAKRALHGLGDLTDAQHMEEVLGDIVGDQMVQPEFWQAMHERNPGKFREVAHHVLNYIRSIIAALQGKKYPYGTDKFIADAEKVRSAVVEAMAKYSNETTGPAAQSDASQDQMAASLTSDGPTNSDRAPREIDRDAGDTYATTVLELLARTGDDLFQIPTPKSTGIGDVFREIHPGVIVRTAPALAKEKGVDKMWLVEPDQAGVKPFGKIYERDGKVWIDVSAYTEEKSGGTKTYAAVMAYAHNNGLKFIGDPDGLSPTAFFRRTENMLSSALKYGTTRHLEPHEAQLDPAKYYKDVDYQDAKQIAAVATPLKWVSEKTAEDYIANLKALMEVAYDNVRQRVPEISSVNYNFDQQRFEQSLPEGRVVRADDAFFRTTASSARARGRARVGIATLKRAALLGTLSRQEGGQAWRRVLGQLGRQLQSGDIDPDLRGTFYSLRGKAEPFTSGAVADNWHPAVQKTHDIVRDAFTKTGKFNWWNKSVGTQIQKARQDESFGKVFWRAQQFVDDIARYALKAEGLAPTVLPKVGGLSDVPAAVKNAIGKGKMSAADNEWLGKVMTEGTLAGESASPMDGRKWTDAELRERFKATDAQVLQYREAMAAIAQSLDDAGKATVMAMLRSQGWDTQSLDALEARAQTMAETVNIARETYAKLPPEQAAKTGERLQALDDLVTKVQQLKDAGYAPLMRFGKFYLTARDSSGDVTFFSRYESRSELMREQRRLAKENRDWQFDRGEMSMLEHEQFKGVDPHTMALFAKEAGLEDDAAFQKWYELATADRSVLKRLIHRKGTLGYSTDARRILASFVTSNARYASNALHGMAIKEATQSISDGGVKDEAIKLSEYVVNPVEEAAAVRGLMFTWYLGGSLASGIVNMTQPLMMGLPYLSRFGIGKASKALAAGMKAAGQDMRNVRSSNPELAAAMDKARADGIVDPSEIFALMAASRGQFSHPLMQAFHTVWGANFALTEAFNRKGTFAAAFLVGRETGMDTDKAYAFAKQAIYDINGIYSRANRPNWARGAVGATIFCVDEETEALTQRGWLGVDSLQEGDMIASFDMKAERLVWKPVQQVFVKDYDGEMVHATSKTLDMMTTPDHRVVHYKRKRTAGAERGTTHWSLEIDEAQNIPASSRVQIPTCAPFDHVPNENPIRDALAPVIGWVVTEGHILKQQRKNAAYGGQVYIHQNEGEKADQTRADLKAAGLSWKENRWNYKGGNAVHIRFCLKKSETAELRELIPGKQLTSELLMRMTKPQIEVMVDRMLLGDGSVQPTGARSFIQSDTETLHAFTMALTILGKSYSIRKHGKNCRAVLIREPAKNEAGRYSISKSERVQYKGRVWCPIVPETSTWVARRNGMPFITHNTFKQYSIAYMEFLNQLVREGKLPKRQLAVALGMLIAGAGLQGLPGADDIDDLIDATGQALGYATNIRASKRRMLQEVFGETLGDIAMYGLSTQLGLDLQGRLGLGNLIPGTSALIASNPNKGRDLVEIAGPFGSLIKDSAQGFGSLIAGNFGDAAAKLTPNAVRNAMKGGEMLATGEARDEKGRLVKEVTAAEAVTKAVGFNPQSIATESRKLREIRMDENIIRAKSADIKEKWAMSLARGDAQGAQEARDELKQWNADNPDMRIVIRPQDLRRRVLDIKRTRAERFEKTVSKPNRQRVAQELAATE